MPGLAWQAEREWARTRVVAVRRRGGRAFAPRSRRGARSAFRHAGIDARRIYYPMHQLPIYQGQSGSRTFPVADRLADRAVCLPTWAGLTRDDVRFVCDRLKDCC